MLAVLFFVNRLSEFFLHFWTSGTCGLIWCALNYPVSLKTLLYTLWNQWQLHPFLTMTWVRANLQVRRMWWSSVLPNFLSLFHVMECRCRAHLEMKYSMRQFAIKLWESQGSKKQASSRQVVHRWSQHQFSAQLSCILSSGKQFSTCEHKANESLTTDWHSDRTQVSLKLTEHMNREDGVGENWCARMLLRWWRQLDSCLCTVSALVRDQICKERFVVVIATLITGLLYWQCRTQRLDSVMIIGYVGRSCCQLCHHHSLCFCNHRTQPCCQWSQDEWRSLWFGCMLSHQICKLKIAHDH